jgi:hypothetical protein
MGKRGAYALRKSILLVRSASNGVTHEYDVVIDRGQIYKRKKKPSKKYRDALGHAPGA